LVATTAAIEEMTHALEQQRIQRWIAELHTTTLAEMDAALSAISAKIYELNTQLSQAVPGGDRAAELRAQVDMLSQALARLRKAYDDAQKVVSQPARNVGDTERQADLGFLNLPPPESAMPGMITQGTAQMHTAAAHLSDELQRQMATAGEQAGRSIVDGMMNGMLDLEGIFKQFLGAFISATLGAIFGKIFGGIVTGGASAAVGGGGSVPTPKFSSVGPASFSLNAGGMVPAPRTPFDVMRDAEWQRALRGSLLVAYGDGFKGR